jgi:LacI family transcriptional regulator
LSTATAASGPRPRATIRDVAALAQVGIKTVSRVINDEANVSTQTRERVERAIRALNFQPHQGAGALRRSDRRTLTVGLLLDAVDNPFSASINRAVEVVASQRETAVFAASFDDDAERERRLVDAFTRRRVDGLILTTYNADVGYLQRERDQGTPMVFIDRQPSGLVADTVVSDNYEAAARATRHLLGVGHRRIAHLGDDLAISTARERRRGFEDAMATAGLVSQTLDIGNLRTWDAAAAAVRELMASPAPPTALFTSQNMITIGAIRTLHELGDQHRVALVGFDDVMLADVIDPGLTVMAQDPVRIGTLAAERLFDRIDGDTSTASTLVVPTRLIVRGSGEIAPS